MSIQAIIFDAGNVLVEYDYSKELAALAALCREPGLARQRIPSLCSVDDVLAGRISGDEFHRRMMVELDADADYPKFLAAMRAGIGGPVPGTDKIVDRLRERYRVALLSNTWAAHWDHVIETLPVFSRLTPWFLSFEMGIAKPDREIYLHAAGTLGLRPEECLFIDDLEVNVQGARDAGMQAVRFTDADELRLALAEYGIEL